MYATINPFTEGLVKSLASHTNTELDSVITKAPDLPFGGAKNSGYGRELAELGIGAFVNKKLIHVAA